MSPRFPLASLLAVLLSLGLLVPFAPTLAQTVAPPGPPRGKAIEPMQPPILVRRDGDRFVLVEGLQRLEACKKLGEASIFCYLVDARKH